MILVTGAAGFIGSQVCQLLSAHGQDIMAVDQRFPDAFPVYAIQTAQGDIRDKEFLHSLFQKHSPDTIIHLAGLLNRASRQQPEEAMQVNVGASLTLLKLGIQFHVSKFIFGSSISAYGPKPYAEHGEVSESESASPNNIYGIAKRYVEIVGEQYRQQDNLPFTALRISMAVGPGAANTASRWRSEIFEKLKASRHTQIHVPFARNEILPLIHVSDLAEMIKYIFEAKQTLHTIYNTPSENWRCSDLADSIRLLNPNIELVFNPSGIRGDPEAIEGRRFIEEFGYRPIPIKRRLQQSMEHLKS
jgi:nucleoside-diphosphate-sugar epimerase